MKVICTGCEAEITDNDGESFIQAGDWFCCLDCWGEWKSDNDDAAAEYGYAAIMDGLDCD